MKKKIALIMSLFLLLSTFVACDLIPSGNSNATQDTSNSLESQSEKQTEEHTEKFTSSWWDDTFEDSVSTDKATDKATERPTERPTEGITNNGTFTALVPVESPDFEGEEITILHRDHLPSQREWYKDTIEDDLDESIAMRNEIAAETLNINVQYEAMASSDYEDCLNTFAVAIMEDVNNDFHYYDIVANYAYAGANQAIRDYLANLADKEVFPYFEFSLPCWNQSIVNTTLINDQLYYITGDLNLSTFDKSIVIFINKTMYDEKKGADDPEDLQDLALAGNKTTGGFTYDELYRWATVVEETNYESGYQHDDFHAISSAFNGVPLDALPYAWDLDFITENADGSHSYNIVGNNKIKTAVEKAQALLNGDISAGVSNDDNTGYCSLGGYTEQIAHFAADKSIFAIHILYNNREDNDMLRDMESEFGILPMPKYDENQIYYGTTPHDSYTLMTVIDHSKSSVPTKGEEVSAYLQYSTEESYTSVRNYYINRIVKPRYFGANDTSDAVIKSIEIFNIIADNIELPFISVYAPQLNGVLSNCWRNVVNGQHDLDATTAEGAYYSEQAIYDTALEEVDSWLGVK